jgi:hypothetical protein
VSIGKRIRLPRIFCEGGLPQIIEEGRWFEVCLVDLNPDFGQFASLQIAGDERCLTSARRTCNPDH